MGNDLWEVINVDSTDARLIDRTGKLTVATTDPETMCIYLSSNLTGLFKARVLVHELGHCALYSFHLLESLHQYIKMEAWIDAEEWVCNFLADYGWKIFMTAIDVLGEDSWILVPKELEKLMASHPAKSREE